MSNRSLKEWLFGQPEIAVEHEVFGKLIFEGNPKEPTDDDYWVSIIQVYGIEKNISLSITAPLSGPTNDQIVFYKNAISNLDALFNECWPIFEPDFQKMTNKKFSGNWKDDFVLHGIWIPKDGDASNDWYVMYEVEASSHYFTARFVDGVPKYNDIDG